MKASKVAKNTKSSRKAFIPGDSGYNRIYPAPQYVSKKVAIIVLSVIAFVFVALFITDFFKSIK